MVVAVYVYVCVYRSVYKCVCVFVYDPMMRQYAGYDCDCELAGLCMPDCASMPSMTVIVSLEVDVIVAHVSSSVSRGEGRWMKKDDVMCMTERGEGECEGEGVFGVCWGKVKEGC